MRGMLTMLPLIANVFLVAHAQAQARESFAAVLSLSSKAIAVGECRAVALGLTDASGRDWPRGPNGTRVSMADFDFSVTAPAARAAVGKYDGPNSFAVCACPKAPAGTVATVTATYPSKWIAPRVRMPGVALTASVSVPIIAGTSSGNFPGCDGTGSSTSGAWLVTVQPTVRMLPLGSCAAVYLTIRDSTGKDTPRGPSGQHVSIADFDMSATSANAGDVVSKVDDVSSFSACACQSGSVGEAVAITAKYPARLLDAKRRVPGVEMQATAPVTLAAARGAANPAGCGERRQLASSVAVRAPIAGATKSLSVEAQHAGDAEHAAQGDGDKKTADAEGDKKAAEEEQRAAEPGDAAKAADAGDKSAEDELKKGDSGNAAQHSGEEAHADQAQEEADKRSDEGEVKKVEEPNQHAGADDPAARADGVPAAGEETDKKESDVTEKKDDSSTPITSKASDGRLAMTSIATTPAKSSSGASTVAAPTPAAVTVSPGVARLSWNAMPRAVRYAVWRASGTAAAIERTSARFTTTQFTDTVPDAHGTYRYSVIAYYANGTQGESAPVTFASTPVVKAGVARTPAKRPTP